MKIRPLITYVACALAGFALAAGAVAHATTYAARYPGLPDNGSTGADAPGRCGWNSGVLSCPFVTGSAFPTTSVVRVEVDFYNDNAATQAPRVQICSTAPGGSAPDCSCAVTGTETQGSQAIVMELANDAGTNYLCFGTTNVLDWWTTNNANYSTLQLTFDTTNTHFDGYKISGN